MSFQEADTEKVWSILIEPIYIQPCLDLEAYGE